MIPEETKLEVLKAIKAGLAPLKVSEPLRLSEWAARNFYLSAESSYVEGRWKAYPYQVAIMDVIGNDDIREIIWQKAARTGYTKIILAAMCYFAEHKKRNQALWQPTDDDRDEYVKTELNPAMRDVSVMSKVFPQNVARSKENTLQQKILLGSTIFLRGGKAAKNYRRLTVDVAILDELDGFDLDIEKEGSPDMLSAKRLEGATFPKHVMGSTPKLKNFSLIEARAGNAKLQMRFKVPCPLCGAEHSLTWGGAKLSHGFKWHGENAHTVRHMCFACGESYTQADYLSVWHQGVWRANDGTYIDQDGGFRNSAGQLVDAPKSIAFVGLWTAYSPQASWVSIVEDWLAARKKARAGDTSAQKTFTNTTLGETWEEELEKADRNELENRAEPYPLRKVPIGGLVLVAGVDVQSDRFELVIYAIGRGEEMWVVDYSVIDANPADMQDWRKLDAYLMTEFTHACGGELRVRACGVDTGGHYTHQAYNFCREREHRGVHAVKGDSKSGSQIKGRSSRQDVNGMGRIIRNGVKLWMVGTDTAKDLLYGRMQIPQPGPGYIHFSDELPTEFYSQLTAESRVVQKTSSGEVYRWIKPPGVRNEVLDCTVYAQFAAHALDLHRYTDRQWTRLERAIQPQIESVAPVTRAAPVKAKQSARIPPPNQPRRQKRREVLIR